jgi:hypothetical protein
MACKHERNEIQNIIENLYQCFFLNGSFDLLPDGYRIAIVG